MILHPYVLLAAFGLALGDYAVRGVKPAAKRVARLPKNVRAGAKAAGKAAVKLVKKVV